MRRDAMIASFVGTPVRRVLEGLAQHMEEGIPKVSSPIGPLHAMGMIDEAKSAITLYRSWAAALEHS
jgi:hypothetical protein